MSLGEKGFSKKEQRLATVTIVIRTSFSTFCCRFYLRYDQIKKQLSNKLKLNLIRGANLLKFYTYTKDYKSFQQSTKIMTKIAKIDMAKSKDIKRAYVLQWSLQGALPMVPGFDSRKRPNL